MASHLEPTEVAGYGTFGQCCEIGGVIVKVDTVNANRFYIRITGHTERMLAAKRVRHRRGRLVDKTTEPT